jgi:hypothetical protein
VFGEKDAGFSPGGRQRASERYKKGDRERKVWRSGDKGVREERDERGGELSHGPPLLLGRSPPSAVAIGGGRGEGGGRRRRGA